MAAEFVLSIHDIDPQQWNHLAPFDSPFVRHEFLAALEDTGATSEATGWRPRHLALYEAGELVLVMPAFIKDHSMGEYVFDWAWADAYQHYGLSYYPKLVTSAPFTPCRGPRLLGQLTPGRLEAVTAAVRDYCQSEGLSGWHCLFPDPAVSEALAQHQTQQRLGCQFHWFNHNYRDFDDFLARFASRKRKNVKKERRRVREQGFEFQWLTGTAITREYWELFYELYCRTYLKRSGHPGYLNQAFFLTLGERLPGHCVMVVACLEGRPVAAALYLRDSTSLYGRYWGCLAEFDGLHFETCYYQGIDYAIAERLERFDGGAQGEHKIPRGFEPVITYSNHWLADERFRAPVADFLEREAEMVHHYFDDARAHLPYAQRHD